MLVLYVCPPGSLLLMFVCGTLSASTHSMFWAPASLTELWSAWLSPSRWGNTESWSYFCHVFDCGLSLLYCFDSTQTWHCVFFCVSEWRKHVVCGRRLQRPRPLRLGLAERGQTGWGQGALNRRLRTLHPAHTQVVSATFFCCFMWVGSVLQRVSVWCRLSPDWLQHHSDLRQVSSLFLEPGERRPSQEARAVWGRTADCFPHVRSIPWSNKASYRGTNSITAACVEIWAPL